MVTVARVQLLFKPLAPHPCFRNSSYVPEQRSLLFNGRIDGFIGRDNLVFGAKSMDRSCGCIRKVPRQKLGTRSWVTVNKAGESADNRSRVCREVFEGSDLRMEMAWMMVEWQRALTG